ncbi:5'/3'-nucleotidase SurE [Porphyromonas crevioricanis]|uniref:5'-nucleotidase SurE n=1 Tax=Porphyromonas crevioricanis TaxID=393921 RepID=A0A2X4Q0V8_9PORP|nr:5'/3'-nucleotidase SurE [Porphyromonas crevioricanis]GAD08137.1 5-nucleotidase SurE [Porphyromonas crevioricanis JCM 13913]SQH73727.1 5'-nucleotidase surE [Porphyromonas crevioricanis]
MSKSIRILVVNDDGYRAQGIRELSLALRELGEVTILAPDESRSGASGAITSSTPISLKERKDWIDGVAVYSTSGMPVDCVKLAMNTLFREKKPDLVVSGINHGRNDGICVIYSGTLGAAMEGSIAGVPSLAVSLNDFEAHTDMQYAAEYAVQVARYILGTSLPEHTFLSLNLPKGKPKGLKVCPQTNGRFVKEYNTVTSPKGSTYYWMSGWQESKEPSVMGDVEYLNDGYATLTPIHTNMTKYEYLQTLGEDFASFEA